jgi:hypothetical protein
MTSRVVKVLHGCIYFSSCPERDEILVGPMHQVVDEEETLCRVLFRLGMALNYFFETRTEG